MEHTKHEPSQVFESFFLKDSTTALTVCKSTKCESGSETINTGRFFLVWANLGGPIQIKFRDAAREYGPAKMNRASFEFLIVPPGTSGRLCWSGAHTALQISLHEDALLSVASNAKIELRAMHFDVEMCVQDAMLWWMLGELHEETNGKKLAGEVWKQTIACQLAVHLLRRYGRSTRVTRTLCRDHGGSSAIPSLPTYKLNRVKSYIVARLDKTIRLEELSQIAGFTPWYFARIFKQATGSTPQSYVRSMRIESAKRLLRETDMSLIDVSAMTGFCTQSHFTGVFRDSTGTTPALYRRLAR